MSVQIETNYIPSSTVETSIVLMPEVDYKKYRRSEFMLGPVTMTYMLIGFPGCAATLIGGMYASFVLHFSEMGSLGIGLLLSLIISSGALYLGQKLEDKHLRIREELLKKHGLKYNTRLRRWPRHRVELDKKAT